MVGCCHHRTCTLIFHHYRIAVSFKRHLNAIIRTDFIDTIIHLITHLLQLLQRNIFVIYLHRSNMVAGGGNHRHPQRITAQDGGGRRSDCTSSTTRNGASIGDTSEVRCDGLVGSQR